MLRNRLRCRGESVVRVLVTGAGGAVGQAPVPGGNFVGDIRDRELVRTLVHGVERWRTSPRCTAYTRRTGRPRSSGPPMWRAPAPSTTPAGNVEYATSRSPAAPPSTASRPRRPANRGPGRGPGIRQGAGTRTRGRFSDLQPGGGRAVRVGRRGRPGRRSGGP